MINHRPRLVGATLLGTRQAAALLIHRHPDQVRRRCQPVACDAATKALLYDLDEAERTFAQTARRAAS